MSRRSPDPARLRDFFGSFHQSGSQLIGHLSQVSGQRRGNVYFIAQAHCVCRDCVFRLYLRIAIVYRRLQTCK